MMKCPKLSPTADSGVTNTTDAHSCGRSLLHSTHSMPDASYRSLISLRNDTNGTTTTVKPPTPHPAGNMKIMLFPPPVPITTTTRLSCRMIARNAASCTPRNLASGPTIFRNYASMSTCHIVFHHQSSSSVAYRATSANRDGLAPPPPPSRNTESNMQNACHSRLTRRNPIRRASVLNNDSSVERP